MSHWAQDEAKLRAIDLLPGREEWVSYKAGQLFHQIAKKFPEKCRDVARVGVIEMAEFPGAEGLQCCLLPIDGHRKILSPLNRVTLLKASGEITFEGTWANVSYELITSDAELFIFVEPKPGAGRYPLPLRLRLQGWWRYLAHKVRSK